MTVHITKSIWLNTTDICSFEHVLEVSGLTRHELQDLIETGLIQPSNSDPGNYFFQSQCIVIARRARRLRDDFELDMPGVSLALKLLERIDELETQLDQTRQPGRRRPSR